MDFLEKMTFMFWISLIFLLFYASTIYFNFFGINKKIKQTYYFIFNNIIPVSEKNSNKKLKLKLSKAAAFISHIVFLVFLIAVFFSVAYPYGGGSEENKLTGPLGDLFNGLITPILSFLTFCGLLITIMIQNLQMKATLQELELTRKEMADSTTALEAQVKNSTAQKFDSNFYSMLQFHMNTVEILKSKKNIILYEFDNFKEKGFDWQKFYSPDSFRNFFLINYQILKFVRKHELSGQLSSSEAKQYSNIVRAVIDDDICGLIFLNCINTRFTKYRELIEHYEFLEHFVFSGFHNAYILKLISMYRISTFGDKENLFNFIYDKRGLFVSFVFEDKLSSIENFVKIWESSGMDLFKKIYENKIDLIEDKLSDLLNFKKRIFDSINNFSAEDFVENHDLITSIIDKNDLFLIKNSAFDLLEYFQLWKDIYELIGKWSMEFYFVEEHIQKIELQLE